MDPFLGLSFAEAQGLPDGLFLRPLHSGVQILLLLWLGAMLAALPRARGAWAATALAFALRWLTFEPRVHMHGDKPYDHLVAGWGLLGTDPIYGEAWRSLLGIAHYTFGTGYDLAHVVAAIASGLTPLWVHTAVARAWPSDPRAADAAALLAAVLPLPLALAPTETVFPLLALAQTVAVAAALGTRRRDDLLAALSIGVLIQCRPLQLPMALVIGAILLFRRRWLALAAAGALFAWRVDALDLAIVQHGGVSNVSRGAKLDSLARTLLQPSYHVGPGAHWIVTDPRLTPVGVAVAAALGAGVGLRQRMPQVAALLAMGTLGALVHWSQDSHADMLRFHLAEQSWWAALAGIGVASLMTRPRWLAAWAAVAVLSFLPATGARHPEWAWVAQHRLLRDWVQLPPDGVTVRVHPQQAGGSKAFLGWTWRRSEATWRAQDGPLEPGEWVFAGLADVMAGDAPDWDRLEPVVEAWLAPEGGGVLNFGDEPVRVGLFRVVQAPTHSLTPQARPDATPPGAAPAPPPGSADR